MESTDSASPIRKRLIAGAVAIGTVFGAAGVANAVTNGDEIPAADTPATSDDTATTPTDQNEIDEGDDDDSAEHESSEADEGDDDDSAEDGEDEENDDDENKNALTGAIADEVTAAAQAAVPGGTVDRVEQDGSGYEAQVTDADGNEVEVHFDQDMNVGEIEQGD